MTRVSIRPSTTPFGSRLLGRPEQSPRALRLRVQILLTAILLATNLVGVGVVVSLLLLVRPDEPLSASFRFAHLIAVPVYTAVAFLVGTITITRRLLTTMAWARDGRIPTEAEARDTLRAPRMVMLRQGGLWAISVVLFTGLAWRYQPSIALTEALALSLAGTLVCAIAHLWTEFVLRPVTALALESTPPPVPRGSSVRLRLLVYWLIGTGVPVAMIMLVAILALAGDRQVDLTRLAVLSLVLGGVVLLFGLNITGLIARSVVGPLTSVRHALERVQSGELEVSIPVYDATELGLLQSGFNDMAGGLRERERIRDLFGRHVGREVATAALGDDVELGGETRVVSVVFVDLRGSTAMAATRPPAEVVALLNRFCSVVIEEVDGAGGLVNKFMGDAVLAIFGAPYARPDHASNALRAARGIARRLALEVPEISAGVGVSTGEAVAGNVGAEQRFEYTVIGDAVNTAARLTDLAKGEEGAVLAAGEALDAASTAERSRWKVVRTEVVRGRSTPTDLAVPIDG